MGHYGSGLNLVEFYHYHGRYLTLESGGQEKKKKEIFFGCSLCIKIMRYCNTLCQYSAVKNNLKRLPAFTKLWNFDSCC